MSLVAIPFHIYLCEVYGHLWDPLKLSMSALFQWSSLGDERGRDSGSPTLL